MYKILKTGSKANAIIYHNKIMVDCGVPYSVVMPYIKDISIVLLTHSHNDHLNIKTLKKIQFERPSVRVGCGEFLIEKLTENGIKNIDVYKPLERYGYLTFDICPVQLYHDVPNLGYRIIKDEKIKIFHATDTGHLQGITAKNYDLYALEANYDEAHIWEVIQEKELRGEFAHQRGAMETHLSVQQCQDFIIRNVSQNHEYEFIQLHQSSEF
jgi:L-ascorbate metabolism protein UlaG (beta-lactamase superfamily)